MAGKWIVRKVADRYLPRDVSSMKKKGFTVTAHKRMEFGPGCFESPFIESFLGFSAREMDFFMEYAPRSLKGRLMQVGVWADLFLFNETEEAVLSRLRDNVTFRSGKRSSG
ncbi:MAG: hypothetical protein V2A76_10475, partial [Planctomycetota bacterium]